LLRSFPFPPSFFELLSPPFQGIFAGFFFIPPEGGLREFSENFFGPRASPLVPTLVVGGWGLILQNPPFRPDSLLARISLIFSFPDSPEHFCLRCVEGLNGRSSVSLSLPPFFSVPLFRASVWFFVSILPVPSVIFGVGFECSFHVQWRLPEAEVILPVPVVPVDSFS